MDVAINRLPVTRQSAEAFIAARFGQQATLGPDIPQGEWSSAFAFTVSGHDYVIRFNSTREAFDADLSAMKFASRTIPIPAVIEVGAGLGGFYAVSERAVGRFLEDLDADSLNKSMRSILETMDAMRLADTSSSVGFGPWNARGDGHYATWRDYLLDVEAPHTSSSGWREQLEASPVAKSAFESGFAGLSELVGGCPDLRNLLHADMLNRNVFCGDHGIRALIDWQCAMYGDFLYELAWFTFWAPWHKGISEVDFRARAPERFESIRLAVPDFAHRLRCYEIHIGLRHLVYFAWRRDAVNLEATARRTTKVTDG